MFSAKRLEEIVKILEKEESVDVNSLCVQFHVSSKTIRQDLNKLADMGILERFHGGAILKKTNNNIFPIHQRKRQNLDEKRRIALAACKYVSEHDILIIDGGSTTFELAKAIEDKPIIVITNDLSIAAEFLKKEQVELYVTGGKLRREGIYSLLGRDAERIIQRYNANKVFLGTSALDFHQGLMVFSAEEAELKKAMISAAKEVICLVDYSKFHQLALTSFATLEDIDVLITDDRISGNDQTFLKKNHLNLEIV